MIDYQIRLYKIGGALSVIIPVVAIDLADARLQAFAMFKEGMVEAEIWTNLNLLDTVAFPDTPPN